MEWMLVLRTEKQMMTGVIWPVDSLTVVPESMAVVANVWPWSQAGQLCSKFAVWWVTSEVSGWIWKHLRTMRCLLPPVDCIWAMMIIGRIRGKIIRIVWAMYTDVKTQQPNCCVLYCVWQLCTVICTHSQTHTWALLKLDCWFRISLALCLLLCIFCNFVPVLFAFVALGLVYSVPVLSQEIG